MVSTNPRRKVRRRLDVTFTDKSFEMTKTQAAYSTDKPTGTFKKTKIMLKEPRDMFKKLMCNGAKTR